MCLWCSDEAAASQESDEVNSANWWLKSVISQLKASEIPAKKDLFCYLKDTGEGCGTSGGKQQHNSV